MFPDIEKFHSLCEDMMNLFTRYPQLYSDSLLLSRIIYRMKQKFRTSKDFKALEKLSKCLHRYFSLNLSFDLQSLKELLPDNYSDQLYLPSRNLVEYVLVRLQGVSKLMEYIIETSTDIAHMLTIRIYTGHFWKIGFIVFSIVSRIYVLSRYTLKAICNFYSQLLPISKQLKTVGKVWLPKNYVFPQNLEEWLDINLSKLDQNFQQLQGSTSVPEILHYFNLVNDSDSDLEISDEYMVVKENDECENKLSESNGTQSKVKSKTLTGFTAGEDIGEIIQVMSDSNDDISMTEDLGETMSDCNNELDNVKANTEKKFKKPLSMGKIKKKKKKGKSSMQLKLFAATGDNYKGKTIPNNEKLNQLKEGTYKKFKNFKTNKKK